MTNIIAITISKEVPIKIFLFRFKRFSLFNRSFFSCSSFSTLFFSCSIRSFSNWILKDDYPSEKTIQKFTDPILIIHGTADTLVPFYHAKILYEQRKNNAELHLLAEKGHRETFWAEETPTLISNWLKSL